jgi:quinol monooxygenase YgiN
MGREGNVQAKIARGGFMVTHVHVAFRVEDYTRWKTGYDASAEQRKASGEISFSIYQNADDPNIVSVFSVQQSAERVKAFINSPDLRDRMKSAGVVEMGKMYILKETDSGVH